MDVGIVCCGIHGLIWRERSSATRAGDVKAERAMRRLDARFDGEGPGHWTFDGEPISDEVAEPLLILHDDLNDLDLKQLSAGRG
jgi:hypothetical protein